MKAVPGYQKAWDPDTSPAAAAAIAAKCKPALDELRAGLAYPYAAPPLDPTTSPMPGAYKDLRDVARLLAAESRVAAGKGDRGRALRCLADALRLARNIARDTPLYPTLVGMACESTALGEMTSLGGSLDARQCRDAARLLEEHERARAPFRRALERETATLDAIWPGLERETDKLQTPLERAGGHLLLATGKGQTKALCLEIARQSALPAGTRTLAEPATPPASTFWSVFAPAMTLNDAHLARLRLLQVELCFRAHRLEKGRPAGSLADLVPEYLPALPMDPFGSGQTLSFCAEEDGHAYSLGPDGKESDGRVLLWREARVAAEGDLFVRLGQREPRSSPGAEAKPGSQ